MGGDSKQKNTSTTRQSSLTDFQEQVVKSRENIYQTYFMPMFKNLYGEMAPDSSAGAAQMAKTAGEINRSYDSAQRQTQQQLAQRNLAGTGAGMALEAANNRARSGALSQAYTERMASSTSDRGNALSMLAGTMNQPTTATPMVSDSKGSATQSANLWNLIF